MSKIKCKYSYCDGRHCQDCIDANTKGIIVTDRRDVFILPGISREAFTDNGVKLTLEDPSLEYYIHQHSYDLYGAVPCNDQCTVVRMGKVDRVELITHSDVANPHRTRVS